MPSVTSHLVIALALSTSSNALLSQRDDSTAVPSPFDNLEDVHVFKRDSSKTAEAPLVIYGDSYWMNASIGTPPQSLSFLLDLTRSRIEPAYTLDENYTCSDDELCSEFGFYKPTDSSTYQHLTYTQRHDAGVDYTYSDTITLGDHAADQAPLDIPSIKTQADSSLGLSSVNTSFPYILVDRGLTTSPSFSLIGDNGNTTTPSIIFGGINTSKFNGPLQAFSFADHTITNNPFVTLEADSLQLLTNTNDNSTYPIPSSTPIMLRTDELITYLPNSTVQSLYNDLNITTDGVISSSRFYGVLPCSRQESEFHTFSLVIGNMTFSVGWDELFVPWTRDGLCKFGIQAQESDYKTHAELGVPFVRRMYVAVDYNNQFVGVATLKDDDDQDEGEDEVVEIGTGTALPSAVGDWPASVTAYTPAASTGTAAATLTFTTATSSGGGVVPTGLSELGRALLVPGVLGMAVLQAV
ncbi:acid protease [Aspergillus eucalypticola CBS 122712]|uniref:Acid protease n=1 Tax=Aspergillus eucalypticola (strain CBS 122712 / IBT 29274) TaxID=1448314 RepID=A0A317WA55_ASPEC|nr:acid protease [Aspergillus eucalypticola CBS 122712]PWY82765.1 acid protease [Aspergillus eucalypticola CBS 122712]